MRIFPGALLLFDDLGGLPTPQRFAPAIELRVADNSRGARIDFLIDTGTETTTLYPSDARKVLGAEFDQINFDAEPSRVVVLGAGGEEVVAVQMALSLMIADDANDLALIADSILVAQPKPHDLSDPDAGRGNWDTPSLLGRDLLVDLELHLSYPHDTVYLADLNS